MSEEKTVDIESMSAKDALGYFLPKVDEDARKAKKEGRLVCWSASVAPPEFCTAMDIAIVYPETHAAGIGARHGAPAMLEVAENKGYNQDICSYKPCAALFQRAAVPGLSTEVISTWRTPSFSRNVFCSSVSSQAGIPLSVCVLPL